MYGEEFPEETWLQRNGFMLYGVVLTGALLGGVYWAAFPNNQTPQPPPVVKILNEEKTNELAAAKCGEYEMDWLQYTDIGLTNREAVGRFEAVLYCINRETKVTIRETIPLIFDEK